MLLLFLILRENQQGVEMTISNSKGPVKFVSLNNHLSQAGPTLVNINSDETLLSIS